MIGIRVGWAMKYSAFISYSHARDQRIAASLQYAIQTLGRPWYKLYARRVFRDDTSLSASPHLWPSIQLALDQSEYFVLLACPEAADSPWVLKEVSYWIGAKSPDKLLIALTEGTLSWDNAANDFVEARPTSLPAALKNQFTVEPKWTDLREFRAAADPHEARFLDAAANFAAAIGGIPKEHLLYQERRRRRSLFAAAWSVSCALLALAAVAGWQWHEAVGQKQIAQIERDFAQKQRDRAEKNYAAAKDTVKDLVTNIVQGIRFVPGMRSETVSRILNGVNGTIGRLIKENPNDADLQNTRMVMLDEFAKLYTATGDIKNVVATSAASAAVAKSLLAKDEANPVFHVNIVLSTLRLAEANTNAGDISAAKPLYEEAVAQWQWFENKPEAADDPKSDMPLARSKATGGAAFALVRLGWLDMQSGDMAAAGKRLKRCTDITRDLGDKADLFAKISRALSFAFLSEIQVLQHNFSEALINAKETVSELKHLSTEDADNLLLVSMAAQAGAEVANVAYATGDLATARNSIEESVKIYRRVVAADSGNMQLQGYLADLLGKTGQVYISQNDLAAAVVTLKEAFDISERLITATPGSAEWQVFHVQICERLGDAHRASNQPGEARASYERMISSSRVLVGKDSTQLPWQRYLAVALEKAGDLRKNLGDDSAKSAYEEERAIALRLLKAAPDDAGWSRMLAISDERLGDCESEGGNASAAAAYYKEEAEIAQKFLSNQPDDDDWSHIRNYALSHSGDHAAGR